MMGEGSLLQRSVSALSEGLKDLMLVLGLVHGNRHLLNKQTLVSVLCGLDLRCAEPHRTLPAWPLPQQSITLPDRWARTSLPPRTAAATQCKIRCRTQAKGKLSSLKIKSHENHSEA